MKILLLPFAVFVLASCKDKKTDADTDKTAANTTTPTVEKDQPALETENKASIVGKWILSEANDTGMSEDDKKDLIGNADVEFTADGKYMSHSKKDSETGTYTYNKKTKELKTIADGKSEEEKINAEITGDKLTVTQEKEKGAMIFKRVNE